MQQQTAAKTAAALAAAFQQASRFAPAALLLYNFEALSDAASAGGNDAGGAALDARRLAEALQAAAAAYGSAAARCSVLKPEPCFEPAADGATLPSGAAAALAARPSVRLLPYYSCFVVVIWRFVHSVTSSCIISALNEEVA